MEPRLDSTVNSKSINTWPLPQEIESVNCNKRIANTLNEPIMIRRDHIGQHHEVINTTHPSAADHNSQLLPSLAV